MKRLGLCLLIATLAYPLAASAHYADDAVRSEKTAPIDGTSETLNLVDNGTADLDGSFLAKKGEHSKNKSPSKKNKHEKGQATKKKAADRKEHDKKSNNQKKKERNQAGGRGGSTKSKKK